MQLGDAHIWLDHHDTGGRVQLTAQDLHKSGFTTAVGTDQTITVTLTEFDRNVFKQRLGTELHRNIGSRDHSQGFLLADQAQLTSGSTKKPKRRACWPLMFVFAAVWQLFMQGSARAV